MYIYIYIYILLLYYISHCMSVYPYYYIIILYPFHIIIGIICIILHYIILYCIILYYISLSVPAPVPVRAPATGRRLPAAGNAGYRYPLLFYSERGILYYSTPREESFTILLRERSPLLFYPERGILYYSTPREVFHYYYYYYYYYYSRY